MRVLSAYLNAYLKCSYKCLFEKKSAGGFHYFNHFMS